MDKTLEHIINDYIVGSISTEDRIRLEQAMQENAVLAEEVQSLHLSYQTERYVLRKMDRTEQAAFEQKMKENKQLEQQADEWAAAERFLARQRRKQLLDFVEEVAQENKDVGSNRNNRGIGLFILFVIFLGCGWLMNDYFKGKEQSTNPNARDNSTQVPGDTIQSQSQTQGQNNNSSKSNPSQSKRSGAVRDSLQRDSSKFEQQKPDSLSKEALNVIAMYSNEIHPLKGDRNAPLQSDWRKLYKDGEYKEFIENISPGINDISKNDPEARLALGLSYFYEKEYESAIIEFEKLKNSTEQSPARWYKILAHLHLNQQEEAILLLNEIIKLRADSRKRDAADLLKLIQGQ